MKARVKNSPVSQLVAATARARPQISRTRGSETPPATTWNVTMVMLSKLSKYGTVPRVQKNTS